MTRLSRADKCMCAFWCTRAIPSSLNKVPNNTNSLCNDEVGHMYYNCVPLTRYEEFTIVNVAIIFFVICIPSPFDKVSTHTESLCNDEMENSFSNFLLNYAQYF